MKYRKDKWTGVFESGETITKVVFESGEKSKPNMRTFIIGIVGLPCLFLIGFIIEGFDIISFAVLVILSLILWSLIIWHTKKGAIKNVVISDEGIASRLFLKNKSFIRWENVIRAEIVKLLEFSTLMIAVEGYDEISQETKTIYTENRYMLRKLIKEYLKRVSAK